MRLKSRLHTNQYQSGISMVFLLFVMIVIALLAAGLFRLNSSSNLSNAQQVIATRALSAAESGAELQSMQIFQLGGGSSCNNETFIFSAPGLSGCRAVTSCSSFSLAGETFYEVSSQGVCLQGEQLQSARTIKLRLKAI